MGNIGKSSLWNLRLCNKYICLDRRCMITFLILLGVAIVIFLNTLNIFGSFFNTFLNHTFKLNKNLEIRGWLISHFLLYLIIGLICPNQFILFFIIGFAWEIFEYIYFSMTGNKFWTNGTTKFQYIDIIVNTLGYLSGSVFTKLLFS